MNFTLLSPTKKETHAIAWLEVDTPTGNFVILQNHAPTVLIVNPNEPITFCLRNGKQETMMCSGGILEVTRTTATLLLNE